MTVWQKVNLSFGKFLRFYINPTHCVFAHCGQTFKYFFKKISRFLSIFNPAHCVLNIEVRVFLLQSTAMCGVYVYHRNWNEGFATSRFPLQYLQLAVIEGEKSTCSNHNNQLTTITITNLHFFLAWPKIIGRIDDMSLNVTSNRPIYLKETLIIASVIGYKECVQVQNSMFPKRVKPSAFRWIRFNLFNYN